MTRTRCTTEGVIDFAAGEEVARDIEDDALAEKQTSEYITAKKEGEATLLLNRAIELTFLDGHWITLRALFGAGIVTGIPTLDTAIAEDDRTKFNIFFRDKVKARL